MLLHENSSVVALNTTPRKRFVNAVIFKLLLTRLYIQHIHGMVMAYTQPVHPIVILGPIGTSPMIIIKEPCMGEGGLESGGSE